MYDIINEYKIYGLNVKFKAAKSFTQMGEIHPPYEIELHNPKTKPITVVLAIFMASTRQIPFPFGPTIEIQPQETKVIEGKPLLPPEVLTAKDKLIFRVKKTRKPLFQILMTPFYLLYIVMWIYVILAGLLRGGSAQARSGLNFLVALATGGRKKIFEFTRQ